MTPDMERLSEIAQDAASTYGHGMDDQTAEAVVRAILAGLSPPSPAMIAAAWNAWRSRHGNKLGPGPGFREAMEAGFGAVLGEGESCA